METSTCLVWNPIGDIRGAVEYAAEVARALDAPVYAHSYPEGLAEEGLDCTAFRRTGATARLLERSPLREPYVLSQYATWTPPERFDAVVSRGPKAVHTVPRIGRRHVHIVDGTYRGFFLHKDEADAFARRGALSSFLLGTYRLRGRATIQSAFASLDDVVVNSEWTAELVESLYSREADAVIYPPVPLGDYGPERAETGDYYLYLGLIDEHHRVPDVIEAFADLPHRLVVAGSGSWEEEARRRATDNVEFAGYVTGDEKAELLAGARALVNPAHHSFGRSVVEALASGTPVVTLDRGYPPMLIEDGVTGVVYDGGDDALAAAVEESRDRDGDAEDCVAATERFGLAETRRRWRDLVDN